ncbi:MAG: hypothetical protein JST12_17750 [Armatimonadetes bacterium]|nr:hypothetical protein [Armatimonadota bacterium]
MNAQREDFRMRAKEVIAYIRWIEANESHLGMELVSTIRASSLLLIYNLVESSARSLTQVIVDLVDTQRLRLPDLSPKLRREFLRQAWNKNEHYRLVESLDDNSYEVTQNYDPSELFSGNVDSRKISARLEALGCGKVDFGKVLKINSRLLVDLKENRNDLAHGVKSFSEVGSNITVNELKEIFVVAFYTIRYALRVLSEMVARNEHLK